MKKIIAISIMLVTFLTGCGVPNPAADARKELDIKFLSNEEEVYKAKQSVSKKEKNTWLNAELKEFVSEERKKQLDQLFVELDKMSNENIIEEYAGEDSFYWEIPLDKIALEDSKEIDFVIRTEQNKQEFVTRMAVIGYEGLRWNDIKENRYYCQIISDGVSFILRNDENLYSISLVINYSDLYTPIQFADILTQCYKDGFNIQKVEIGGYIERFVLGSSDNEELNLFQKTIHVYVKDGKLLQMEICARGNGKTTDFIFTEREKETMVNLLTWISKDASASEKFVSELTAEGEDKGEIGSCNWYRTREKDWGNEREMSLRIIEKQEVDE